MTTLLGNPRRGNGPKGIRTPVTDVRGQFLLLTFSYLA